MKIIKESVKLLEDEEIKPAAEVVDELGEQPKDSVDIDTASNKEIVADMAQGAEDEGKLVNVDQLEQESEHVKTFGKFIYNPYSSATARPGKIKRALQRSFEAALRQKRNDIESNYPNVLIYGLAGFGKTSIIQEFCREHGIDFFPCDAKNLDAATIGGIPFPMEDPTTGEVTQAPIRSSYWDALEKPCILFMDEVNRANGRVRGSLLTLINEHKLPAAEVDRKTGRRIPEKFYPNILFTVIAINPADDSFPDAEKLDPAMISRSGAVLRQDGDAEEYRAYMQQNLLKYKQKIGIEPAKAETTSKANAKKGLKKLYSDIVKNNPKLADEDLAWFQGVTDLGVAVTSDPGFHFDSQRTCNEIIDAQENGELYNVLNYRSLTLALYRSNGTKKDFLDVIQHESGFIPEDIKMIKNSLANYTDKVTVGNDIFNSKSTTQTPTPAQAQARSNAASLIDTFMNNL